jgi:4-alpha-glucanotransferase/alpha-amylase
MLLLREMVARGQVELFGGGDTEPVLAAIPHRDRVSQLIALSEKLERLLGAGPAGSWLTERVWESAVVPALVESGIRYVTVDDYHFLCAGKRVAELDGYFTTEEGGARIDLYPISEALRYRIPFAPAAEAVAFIAEQRRGDLLRRHREVRHLAGNLRVGLRQGLAGGVRARRARVRPDRDAHLPRAPRARGEPRHRLPPDRVVHRDERVDPAGAGGARLRGARRAREGGGKVRGREGVPPRRDLAQLHVALPGGELDAQADAPALRALAGCRAARRRPAAAAAPSRQANDAYWHGLFGGLYLPHLRRAVYGALVELEARLDAIAPRPPRVRTDLDGDGVDELFIQNGELQAVVKLDGSASLVELDAYALAQNFGDTLRRHAEHYHRKALEAQGSGHDGPGIASAHDRVRFKHAVTAADLVPDAHARTTFRDAWNERALDGYELAPRGSLEHAASFVGPCDTGRVEKLVLVQGSRVTVTWFIEAGAAGTFRTELNLAMPSCDGYAGRYILNGEIPCGFGQPLDAAAVTELVLDDQFMGGAVAVLASSPALVRARPHLTVSQSEDGFEKIMQCATVSLSWPLAAGRHELSVALKITRHG